MNRNKTTQVVGIILEMQTDFNDFMFATTAEVINKIYVHGELQEKPIELFS